MYLPSSLCRAQEAYHRDRAAGALLDNVRQISTDAAAAWGLEARSAERREARHARTDAPIGVTQAPELPSRRPAGQIQLSGGIE